MKEQWDQLGIFTDDQFYLLLETIKNSSRRTKERDYVIIMMMAKLGIRISQVLQTRTDDIDFVSNWIKLPKTTSKTKIQQSFFMDPELARVIRRYITKYIYLFKEEYIFYARNSTGLHLNSRSFRDQWEYYLAGANLIIPIGVDENNITRYKYNIHSLRHYFITKTIQNNPYMHLSEIKEVTGHKKADAIEKWYRNRVEKPQLIKEIFLNNYTREKTMKLIWEKEITERGSSH